MSEGEDIEEVEEEEGSSVPAGVLAMVGALVFLVAISGMFAIGFIPPLVGARSQATRGGTAQFITLTTTSLATTTVSGPGGVTTITSTAPNITVITATSTRTATTTTTSVNTTTSTTTLPGAVTTVTSTLPTTTTTTATSTTTITSTTTTTPTRPLDANISVSGLLSSSTFPAQTFTFDVAVTNRTPAANLTIQASQEAPGTTPNIVSFFPALPESVQEQAGTYDYKIAVTVTSHAPIGKYALDVSVKATTFANGSYTTTTVQQQYLLTVSEPLAFAGYSIPGQTNQFNGTCHSTTYTLANPPTWVWQCGVLAAPNANGTIQFFVTNFSNQGICLQATLQSNTVTGYVNMSPYPFCPGGGPGVYVPGGAVNWPFKFYVVNGITAGTQTIFFDFTR